MGSVADKLSLFKQSVALHFVGVETCATEDSVTHVIEISLSAKTLENVAIGSMLVAIQNAGVFLSLEWAKRLIKKHMLVYTALRSCGSSTSVCRSLFWYNVAPVNSLSENLHRFLFRFLVHSCFTLQSTFSPLIWKRTRLICIVEGS